MAERSEAPARAEEGVLVIDRVFDAPRELVWKAWTEPARFSRWFGPEGYTIPACEIDFRVGGKYLCCMRSPEGHDMWNVGVYRQIAPMERFVTASSLADEHGNVVPPSHYGMPEDYPAEMQVTVTFEDLGGKTRMTLRHEGFPSGEMAQHAGAGWNGSFDKLAEYLAAA